MQRVKTGVQDTMASVVEDYEVVKDLEYSLSVDKNEFRGDIA